MNRFMDGLVLVWNLRWSQSGTLGKGLIALAGKEKILFGDSSFIMGGELQRDLVKTNVDIRMVIEFLSLPGDPVDESDGF